MQPKKLTIVFCLLIYWPPAAVLAEDSKIIINETWSMFAFVSALVCSILGTIVNILTIMVGVKVQNMKMDFNTGVSEH